MKNAHLVLDYFGKVHMPFNGLVTSQKLIANSPDIVHGLVTGIVKAVRYARAFKAQTMKEFNEANEQAVMSEQIIGLLLTFSVFLAVLIGIGVTSQTLRGAILSNIREFASLRALGISMGSLRLIVMELSFWAGIAGTIAALLLTGGIALMASGIGLPLVVHLPTMLFVSVMMMIIAIISGAMAMGILKKSQPADLLR